MPRHADDPRLTAFALGELDPAEAAEVEAALAGDPEALALVAEVRSTALLLSEHLRAEAAPGLAAVQIRAIEDRLAPAPVARRRRWAGYAIAAGLLGLAATALFSTFRDDRKPDAKFEVAANVAPASPAAKLAPSQADPALADLDAATSIAPAAPSPRPALQARAKRGDPAEPALLARTLPAPAPAPAEPPAATPIASARSTGRSRSSRMGGVGGGMGGGMGGAAGVAAGSPAEEKQSYPGLVDRQSSQQPGQTQQFGQVPPARRNLAEFGREDLAKAPAQQFAFRASPMERRQESTTRPPLPVADNNALKQKTIAAIQGVAEGVPAGQVFQNPLGIAPDALPAGDVFAPVVDNPFRPVAGDEPSTFSIDCDTASYSSVRKSLNQGVRPPRDAVRVEELINYFPYAYPQPRGDDPFSVDVEVARCPWEADHRLVRVGLKGREVEPDRRPPSNLVFLVDVSGSMEDLDKLPLLKAGMKLMVEALGENDRVAIVVYANAEGLALDSTSCARKPEILSALDQLRARGGTDGGRGIALAYEVAGRNLIPGGVNRVILATDGDFNLGVTEGADLDRLIGSRRSAGVSLSVLGLGEGNVRHDRLERIARIGNGQYFFIDSINEARKVLVDQVGGTLVTIAKDVKIQVRFNPDRASAYRLIGYENRLLPAADFADDRKDAGEIGCGHTVTALYEVVPPGQGAQAFAAAKGPKADRSDSPTSKGARLLQVDVRCKAPEGDVSRLFQCPADDSGKDFAAASPDFRFASAVAGFGMLLRDSPYKGTLTWPGLVELAGGAVGRDPAGYRKEFLDLVRKAEAAPAR